MPKRLFSVLSVLMVAACASSQPATTMPPSNTTPETTAPAASDEAAAGSVVCHLSCSQTEAKASGATEEEARANLGPFIDKQCKPEDGQYFVFCDEPK